MLAATGNIALVQRTLAHADIQSTMLYAAVEDQQLADAVKLIEWGTEPGA